jgi:hypothetical protein
MMVTRLNGLGLNRNGKTEILPLAPEKFFEYGANVRKNVLTQKTLAKSLKNVHINVIWAKNVRKT